MERYKTTVVTKRGNHQTSGEPAANHRYFRERPANHQLPLRTISPLISQQIFASMSQHQCEQNIKMIS